MTVRIILSTLIMAATVAGGAWASGATEAAAGAGIEAPRVSIGLPGVSVVELFTSAGCSSCPAADAVLVALLARSRARGAPVYALAWSDPSTLRSAAARQRHYAAEFSSPLSTPEIVVNGRHAAPSADSLRGVERLVEAARTRPALAGVLIAVHPDISSRRLTVRVATAGAPAGSSVGLALVEGSLVQRPNGGENAGRTLRHPAVVRSFVELPAAGGVADLEAPSRLRLARSRVVVFVQTRSLEIVGANEIELGAAGAPSRVSGRLLKTGGRGIGGARVQACSDNLCLPAETDSSGRFYLTGIPAGQYDIKLFLPARNGKPIASLPVEVRAGEEISLPPIAVGT